MLVNEEETDVLPEIQSEDEDGGMEAGGAEVNGQEDADQELQADVPARPRRERRLPAYLRDFVM